MRPAQLEADVGELLAWANESRLRERVPLGWLLEVAVALSGAAEGGPASNVMLRLRGSLVLEVSHALYTTGLSLSFNSFSRKFTSLKRHHSVPAD